MYRSSNICLILKFAEANCIANRRKPALFRLPPAYFKTQRNDRCNIESRKTKNFKVDTNLCICLGALSSQKAGYIYQFHEYTRKETNKPSAVFPLTNIKFVISLGGRPRCLCSYQFLEFPRKIYYLLSCSRQNLRPCLRDILPVPEKIVINCSP